ncbi:hypothetical protein [Rhodanobacter sp. T12-5]|uniref:hypothetical protein n=1 Tax=Rhodanobacter sp. T12-5 TaxID=2024611 RepID=UPI0011ED7009|nr:hypothetical protein [Rhodanobacter sp. T12-5]KAA0070675.1 hypothetical protein CIW53_04760 [Rhodanobacter sp. T12-5]
MTRHRRVQKGNVDGTAGRARSRRYRCGRGANSSYGLQRILLRYLDVRRKQFDLLGQAVLADDEAIQALSEKERMKAEQALADLKALRGNGK